MATQRAVSSTVIPLKPNSSAHLRQMPRNSVRIRISAELKPQAQMLQFI
jgi:hypothetical protein